MKKFFVASVFLGLASLSQAAIITSVCVPAPVTYTGPTSGSVLPAGTGTENCTIGAVPVGGTVNSITFRSTVDGVYDGFEVGGSLNYSLTLGSLVLSGSVSQGGPAQNLGTIGNCTGTCATNVLSGTFSVLDSWTPTGNTNAVTGVTFNKRVTIDYTEYTPPTPGIPEPSTYAMMAAGLVGFYMVRRKA